MSGQYEPHPEVEGTETGTFMRPDQVDALVELLSPEGLQFAKPHSQLKSGNGTEVLWLTGFR